jgi:hypothetical protein
MEFATLYVATCHNLVVANNSGRTSNVNRKKQGREMYSILVLICSTALSHADCQAKTAMDVVRGPTVDNPMMCALNAQTMIARTDLVQPDGTQYMKVVCTRRKNAEEWLAEIEARKARVRAGG